MWTLDANQEQKLLLIKADETLNLKRIQRVFGQIYFIDDNRYCDYDRFADLSAITHVDIDMETVLDIFKAYRRYQPPNDVKVSFYLPYGTMEKTGANASLFRLMAESENIIVHVSPILDECAQYLGVDRALLGV